MHPPLDRPHPRCQDAINNLRDCHANASKFQFWACNEVKTELDRCFRKEKEEMLKQLNANLDEKKKEEEEKAGLPGELRRGNCGGKKPLMLNETY